MPESCKEEGSWKNPVDWETTSTPVQCQCDILKGVPGLKSDAAKAVASTRNAFNLFVTPAMVRHIVESTNRKIEEAFANLPEEAIDDDTNPYLWTMNEMEMYAVFGMMYFRGLLSLNYHNVHKLFAEKTGHHVFGGTMSRERFSFLKSHLCFDDHRTRSMRWEEDRFAAFQGFFSKCSTRHAANMLHPATFYH